ncbi:MULTISPECIES: hypothetical protein [unclassified Providencia]|uniref:hypothetical protein n=1 Tax=unclassified Providencia TaxID=2633465 RepID=UPI00234B639A|nr:MULTISPECIES: hypothetical protein [unclassified Providencia]
MKNLDINSPTTASLIYLSICSIVLSFVFSILINRIKHCLEDNEIDSNLKVAPRNSLDELLLTSITSSQSLLFNLDSGKIYVGVVMKLSESTEKDEAGTFITIYPIMSGYRDKDNQDAKFLTDYPDYSDSSKHQFAVILFKDELTHVSFFDSEYYLNNLKAMLGSSGDPNNTEIETTIADKEPNVQDKSHQRNKHKCIISKCFK